MKNLFLSLAVTTALSIWFTGCSSTGYITAKHNGKMYYVPPNCERFQYFNRNVDELHCYHNGQKTGRILTPASNSQVQNHLYQERTNQQAYDLLNKNLKMQQMNNNLQGIRYGY
jgi:hypothetical protein